MKISKSRIGIAGGFVRVPQKEGIISRLTGKTYEDPTSIAAGLIGLIIQL